MHSQPRSPEGVAKTGPAKSTGRDWRRLAAVAVIGAGMLAFGVAERPAPAVAQLKVGAPAETMSFADILEQVKPAVVSISATNELPRVADNKRSDRHGAEGMPGMPPGLSEDHPLNRAVQEPAQEHADAREAASGRGLGLRRFT